MQQEDPGEFLEKVYSILGNPYKRKIIAVLGERGEVSFSELKSVVGTSTGNLYYNLDGLTGFVSKNEKRKYYLTSEGLKLYNFMVENEARLRSLFSRRAYPPYLERALRMLVPENVVAVLYNQAYLSSLSLAAAAVLILLESFLTGQVCFILDAVYAGSTGPLGRAALGLLGLAVLTALLRAAGKLLGGSGGSAMNLLGMISFSVVPLHLAVLLGWFLEDLFLRGLFFRLVQVTSLGLLTASLKVSGRLPTERAFVAIFTAFYTSYLFSFTLQRFLP
uniref:ArsR family transcriptional regulator n=1 Tax=Thermofilum pendens TaxID=2269 RepID=A0A7C4BAE3_THEPE